MAKASKRRQDVIAGTSGATGGTVLLAIARNVPDTTPGKTWIVYLAPTVGVVLAGLGQRLARSLDDYFRDRRVQRKFAVAMAHQKAIVADKSKSRREHVSARSELGRLEARRTMYLNKRLDDEDVPRVSCGVHPSGGGSRIIW